MIVNDSLFDRDVVELFGSAPIGQSYNREEKGLTGTRASTEEKLGNPISLGSFLLFSHSSYVTGSIFTQDHQIRFKAKEPKKSGAQIRRPRQEAGDEALEGKKFVRS